MRCCLQRISTRHNYTRRGGADLGSRNNTTTRVEKLKTGEKHEEESEGLALTVPFCENHASTKDSTSSFRRLPELFTRACKRTYVCNPTTFTVWILSYFKCPSIDSAAEEFLVPFGVVTREKYYGARRKHTAWLHHGDREQPSPSKSRRQIICAHHRPKRGRAYLQETEKVLRGKGPKSLHSQRLHSQDLHS